MGDRGRRREVAFQNMFLRLTQTLVVFFDVHIKLSQQSGYNGAHLVRFACVGLSNMVVISLSLSLSREEASSRRSAIRSFSSPFR